MGRVRRFGSLLVLQPELPPGILPRLVFWRWGAAFIVFGYHVGSVMDWRPAHALVRGPMGMTFFFMLSGLVLGWGWQTKHRVVDFYIRRISRIYLPGLVALLIVATAVLFWQDGPIPHGPLAFVTSLFSIQAWWPGKYPAFSYDGVSWSLSVELFLYLMFPLVVKLLLALRTRGRVVALGVMVAVGQVGSVALFEATGNWISSNTNPLLRIPEFSIGVFIALELKDGRRLRWPAWLVVGSLLVPLAIITKIPMNPFDRNWNLVLVLPFAICLAALCTQDLDGIRGRITSVVCLYLGSLSFSFYLVHLMVVVAMSSLLGWTHHWSLLGGIAPALAMFVVSFVGALALHHIVEIPGERFMRTRLLALVARRRMRTEPVDDQEPLGMDTRADLDRAPSQGT